MFTKRGLSVRFLQVAAAVVLVAPFVPAVRSYESTGNRIKNFAQVNQNLYRGGRPKAGDYSYLASLGIRTIVDLERGGDPDEKKSIESTGMKFYRIPLSDTCEPTKDQIEEFLRIVNDSKNQPVYLHCRAGRHRTGAMTAIYRIVHDGWTADRAYAEMKQYQFKKGTGHGALKKCVYDYSTSPAHVKKNGAS